MAAIRQTIFSYAFFVKEKFCILIKISLKFARKGQIDNNIGLDNGLAPNRRQVIIWTNADPIHWRIYAAQGGDGLTPLVLNREYSGMAQSAARLLIFW